MRHAPSIIVIPAKAGIQDFSGKMSPSLLWSDVYVARLAGMTSVAR